MHFHLPFSKEQGIYTRFSIAVFLNTMLTIVQVLYAHKSHSVSLLSDALHNLGDVIGLFIAGGAQVLARTTRHPPRYTYGYQKSTLLAAFINSLLLLSSVGIIIYETMMKRTHTSIIDELQVLFIAVLGILINGLTALLFIKEKENDLNIKAAFLHLLLDAFTSAGVVISAVIIHYSGYQWIDSLTALLIAIVISVSGWKLLRHSLELLLGAVPSHINIVYIKEYLHNLPGVVAINNLHIWALGNEKTALTAHLIVKPTTKNIDYSTIQKELHKQFKITDVTLQPVEMESIIKESIV